MVRPEGVCHLCGEAGPLTREHIPPEAAFNNNPIVLQIIDTALTTSTSRVVWKNGKKEQKGNWKYVLCEPCNNRTGSWYGPAYVSFITELARFAHIANTGAFLGSSLVDQFPLRVAKQALCMFAAVFPSEFINENQQFRRLLLNKEYRGSIEPFRLYVYARNTQGMRSSGPAAILRADEGSVRVVGEFSWWPVGWILTWNDVVFERSDACEVSYWLTEFEYEQRETLALQIPCHWTETVYPLDFRSPKQVEQQRHENRGYLTP